VATRRRPRPDDAAATPPSARGRRDLSRRSHDVGQIDALAKITAADLDHAAANWRGDARPPWRDNLDGLPVYEGDDMPSDAERDP
jgi:hypothetical protein